MTISGNDQASGKVRTVKYNVDQLHDKEISITARIKQIFSSVGHWIGDHMPKGSWLRADGGPITPIKGYANAGAVHGPGGPRDDWIPAWLSNGEHVLTAAEVAAAGGQDAVYRLRKLIRDGDIKRYMEATRFADGGAAGAVAPSTCADGGISVKTLRRAMDGMNLELTVDGQTTLTSRMRTVADQRVVTAYRMSRR